MGTITAKKILDDAAVVLQDQTGVRWPLSEGLSWLNDGQRALVGLKPDAYVENKTVQMGAGTKQDAPADANGPVAVVRNMGSGSTPGPAVNPIAIQMLDSLVPGWHSATASGETKFYMTDPGNAKNFYVYPPQPATPTYLELVYPCLPADVSATTDPITLDDGYATALMDYVLFRSFSKETEAGSDARAAAYYNKFVLAIGAKDSAVKA